MSNFDSPITKKNYNISSGAPLKEFNVSDLSEEDIEFAKRMEEEDRKHMAAQSASPRSVAEMQAQVNQARKEKASGSEQLSLTKKKRFEFLANIGRAFKDVEIESEDNKVVFTLGTLKSKENKEITMLVLNSSQNDAEFMFESRRHILAKAIHKINGLEVSDYIGDDSFQSRLDMIDEMDEILIEKLNAEYTSLSNESKKKYGLISQEVAKEVVEDAKK